MKRTEVYAHRGFSAMAPENTMAAFQRAVDAGADGVELDVHLTKDNKVVVIHDETVKRTTDGTGKVRELTLEELRRLDAGSWFDPEFKGEKIPTLEEVLQLVAEHGMKINIELKNNRVIYPELEQKVANLLQQYGLVKQAVISSFNHYSLKVMKQVQPEIDTAILYMEGLVDPWVYAKHAGATSLHPYWYTVVEEVVKGCQKENLPVRPFTVNQPKGMRRLLQLGVDAIITDKPDVLREEMEKTAAISPS
ncbi:glycerophosphoryl diester phosphodiesterase [Marinithermofilum abyssi]|uniref:Glycerophosphoryl diester phosphodiesterase n=1 Tax=Marinithermofilum abyssi TaxID=1571185 RepID=A0A8J2VIE2_9BACL|nr:glycerophosphodiester phosphodiesterase [Marinithermofilum abyssi]GGE22856.1 glycerophosphoryl diester phosphodiesterase [Marinithermofilum abyssi]